MFNEKHLEKLSKLLSIDKKYAILFAKRLQNWIRTNGDELPSLIKGINVILQDIKIKEEQEKKINLNGIKHKAIITYAKEIIDLANSGLGSRKIANYIATKHKIKVGYATIYNFLKQNKHLLEKNG
ncbi:hypothetical protein JCM11957_15210 [Caminibacter profundus]